MTLSDIKKAVDAGLPVYWKNTGYPVVFSNGQYRIKCTLTQHAIGLTWLDGRTLNGREGEFFVGTKER